MFVLSFTSSKSFIDSFVLRCTMIRLFLSLTIISTVIVSIRSSDGYTVHNSLLTGHVFKTIKSIDWLQCVEECHKHDECISYNYFPPKKTCELNNFGYDNQCEAGNNVIRATGWIHHVLDISNMGCYRHLLHDWEKKIVSYLTFAAINKKSSAKNEFLFLVSTELYLSEVKDCLHKLIHHQLGCF